MIEIFSKSQAGTLSESESPKWWLPGLLKAIVLKKVKAVEELFSKELFTVDQIINEVFFQTLQDDALSLLNSIRFEWNNWNIDILTRHGTFMI